MKKIKYLPLLGASLLALAACSSGSNEISRKKALAYYDPDAAIGYFVSDPRIQVSALHDTSLVEVVKIHKNTSVEAVTSDVASTEIYSDLNYFQDAYYPTVQETFFNDYEPLMKSLATFFQEKLTYDLENKKVSFHFTGSTEKEVNDVKYGYALHLEAKFNKVGLLTESKYQLVVTADIAKDGAVDTNLKYSGILKFTWVN